MGNNHTQLDWWKEVYDYYQYFSNVKNGVVNNSVPMGLMLLCISCGNTASIQRKQERVREEMSYLAVNHCRIRTFVSIYTWVSFLQIA